MNAPLVRARAKVVKVTLVLDTESLPKVQVNGTKQVALDVESDTLRFTTMLNSKSYRKAMETLHACDPGQCLVIVQGTMTETGRLESTGITAYPKNAAKASPEAATPSSDAVASP